ncbi:PH domain-containing protein [Candidatus Kuenenbacteria bacterium]|nr:PH domain-containing protein [Candidatus Kuenenbacteria bacterium]
MSKEIQSILEKNEKIVWEGKQDLKATMITSIISAVFLILFAFIIKGLFSSGTGSCTIRGTVRPSADCNFWSNAVAYLIMILGASSPILAFLYQRVTKYVITEKRLLLKSGLIGADMVSIYYDQIKTSFVKVGLIGKILGTGSILIDTGKISHGGRDSGSRVEYDKFNNVKKPYEVYKHVQKRTSSRKENLYAGKAAE